jgi:hypothetical protein
MILLDELSPAYVYTRPDQGKVYCWGPINDTPNLCIELGDAKTPKTLNIQFYRTFNNGNCIKTWRSWAKFFNKYSQHANHITKITSKEDKS